jgi:LysR family hydrogen peroxide-inducible transcriptional activator
MEMHQVRYFLALRTERGFTRGAERCGVSQPTLTRAIKQVERESGGALFLRRPTANCLSDLGFLVERQFEAISRAPMQALGIATSHRESHTRMKPTVPRLASMRP